MGMTEPEQLNMHHRNVSNFNKTVVKSNLAVKLGRQSLRKGTAGFTQRVGEGGAELKGAAATSP